MTEFLTNHGPKVRRTAKIAGGGLGAGALVFMYATFASKTDLEHAEARAAKARDEMRAFQSETWSAMMDLKAEAAAARAALDMLARRAGRPATDVNAVAATNR